jgi:hypothetical protein
MARLWDAVLRVLTDDGAVSEHPSERGKSSPPLVVGPSAARIIIQPSREPTSRVVIGPTPRTRIDRVNRPVWEEKGWTSSRKDGDTVFEGFFEVVQRRESRRRRFSGVIRYGSDGLAAYIADPPPEIRKHPKGPCFALTQAPWFRVHWRRAPKDVDNAILYVETVLDESLNR